MIKYNVVAVIEKMDVKVNLGTYITLQEASKVMETEMKSRGGLGSDYQVTDFEIKLIDCK